MELPNYFLADLPPEARLSPLMITEACQALKRNRREYLVDRPTLSIIDTISEVANDWLQPDNPFREMALTQGPPSTGFSPATLTRGLDSFWRRLTYDRLVEYVTQELGHPERLDRFSVTEPEIKSQRSALACGPELLVQFAAGNVPNPTLTSLVLGLLTRSAQFVKCARGGALLPRLFAHSLYAVEPKLASCIEIASWPGGQESLEEVLLDSADCVTATGTDETLRSIEARVPPEVRFLGYGHRVSFGYIAREVLSRYHAKEIAASAASDVAAWDQLGCLSPHVYYVESGGGVTPDLFGQMLADQLEKQEQKEPRGPLSPEISALITSRRSLYEVRAANSPDTRVWSSPDSTAWTVVVESDPRFQTSCLHRFIYVKGVADLDEALRAAAPVQTATSTIALAAIGQRAHELARELARWGATRICPIGQMQDPPFAWRHDGRPNLADLVRWTDWEQ